MARVPVSRDRVVRVATAIVDARGVDALSMRGLATELGVTAMALYRHVGSRDELLHYARFWDSRARARGWRLSAATHCAPRTRGRV